MEKTDRGQTAAARNYPCSTAVARLPNPKTPEAPTKNCRRMVPKEVRKETPEKIREMLLA